MAKPADPPHSHSPCSKAGFPAGHPERVRVIQVVFKGCVTAHSLPDSSVVHSDRLTSEENVPFCHSYRLSVVGV